MKKILALLLAFMLMFSFAACGGTEDVSDAGDESENVESTVDESVDVSDDESDEESVDVSDDESDDVSTDVSDDDTSTDDPEQPDEEVTVEFTNKFISWARHYQAQITELRPTDATSLPVSKINNPVSEKDVGVFTSEYGKTIASEGQDYADFAVVVLEYNHTVFGYVKTSFAAVGEADPETKIPKDGFVVAIHKEYSVKINAFENALDISAVKLNAETSVTQALSAVGGTVVFYPHGFIVNNELDKSIKERSTAPTIDGKISSSEYGRAIWSITPENEQASYAVFELGQYYAEAEVYLTYDSEKLYIGVIVDSPYHYNTLKAENAVDMWRFECIQVNISSLPATSDYISEHWDYNTVEPDRTAPAENVIRQYGFCVNDAGETISVVWIGGDGKMTTEAEVVCERDDVLGYTYYEAAIPWTEFGNEEHPIVPEEGTEFGFAISINCGNAEKEFRTVPLRDGGSVIGINDWTKMPTITLE